MNTLYLQLSDLSEAGMDRLKFSLDTISRYHLAIRSGSNIMFEHKGRSMALELIKDLSGQPDLNLTLVAGLNRLSEKSMLGLMQKVDTFMTQQHSPSSPDAPYGMYNMMFRIKSLSQRLVRPPVEINNVRWLMVDRGQKVVAASQSDMAENEILPTTAEIPLGILAAGKSLATQQADEPSSESQRLCQAGSALGKTLPATGSADSTLAFDAEREEKAKDAAYVLVDKRIMRFLEDHIGAIEDQREVIESLYGNDYDSIDTAKFSQRLKHATDLLFSLEKSPKGEQILDSVIATIQKKMEQVPDDVFDEVIVTDDEVRVKSGSATALIGKVHARLLSMISLFKERSETKKKMDTIRRQGMNFESVDYAELAERFGVSDQDVKDIIEQFKKCFDQRGYFLRAEFETRIAYFITHEKKIFEFLWSYLKETLHRTDRVAFLNSLQILIQQMKQPKKALRFLLADLCHEPGKVNFSDRNAFMLASLLLRKYNKELNTDIELTPEEVLFVKKGLNNDISRYAAWRLDVDQQRFEAKIETVHQNLIQTLENRQPDGQKHKPHFLLSLEREAYIFLSLVSGKTARHIIVKALQEYGNPASEIYTLAADEKILLLLLQHLKVLIRGMGRVGQIDDLNLLAGLKKNEEGFCRLYSAARNEETVRRILLLADVSMKNITTLE
jgi:hypothetical protein